MRFDGQWKLCDDGVIRPVLRGWVRLVDGSWTPVPFLVDSAADRTVFHSGILEQLHAVPRPSASGLAGVGGKAASVEVQTKIAFLREDGSEVRFGDVFAAFTQPEASDMSILGRDILNHLAVIVDRPRDVVCLLGPGHHYDIRPG